MDIEGFADPNYAITYAVYIDGVYVGTVSGTDIIKASQDASSKYGGASKKLELKPV